MREALTRFGWLAILAGMALAWFLYPQNPQVVAAVGAGLLSGGFVALAAKIVIHRHGS